MNLKLPVSLLAAGLLAASGTLYAQGSPTAPDKSPRQEQREKMKAAAKKERSEAFNKAYDACKGKNTGDEFRSCMRDQRMHAKK
jgi:hypothetical protein